MNDPYLDSVAKAVRNIINGENAFSYRVGRIQATIVKVLMEEGVMPLQLLERGHVRTIEKIKELEEKKHEVEHQR